jgi:hypothetical protein
MAEGNTKAPGKVTGAGPVPDDLDERVVNRDLDPLPTNALVKFQAISHSPDPRTNVRWILFENGDVRLAYHSKRTDGAVPFDTKLPKKPAGTVDKSTVDEIRELLAAENFAALAPYQWRDGEGGAYFVVTARNGDGGGGEGDVHEVIYDRASTPLVDRLQGVPGELLDDDDDDDFDDE